MGQSCMAEVPDHGRARRVQRRSGKASGSAMEKASCWSTASTAQASFPRHAKSAPDWKCRCTWTRKKDSSAQNQSVKNSTSTALPTTSYLSSPARAEKEQGLLYGAYKRFFQSHSPLMAILRIQIRSSASFEENHQTHRGKNQPPAGVGCPDQRALPFTRPHFHAFAQPFQQRDRARLRRPQKCSLVTLLARRVYRSRSNNQLFSLPVALHRHAQTCLESPTKLRPSKILRKKKQRLRRPQRWSFGDSFGSASTIITQKGNSEYAQVPTELSMEGVASPTVTSTVTSIGSVCSGARESTCSCLSATRVIE